MVLPSIDERRYAPCDVLVAGGGMAGISAAVAAARMGARTVLVEQAGWLGGLGVTGATGLHSFFNIAGAHRGAPLMRVVGGIGQELVDAVQRLAGGVGHVRMERGDDFVTMLTPVEPETFKLAAARLCTEAGVRLLLHTVVDEIHSTRGAVEGVVVWNKAGRSLLRARVYIDATGDGDLAAHAGVPFERFRPGDPGAYSAGFTFRLCNIDLAAMEADLEGRGVITQLAHATKPGMAAPDLVRIGIDMQRLGAGLSDPAPSYFLASSLRPRELTCCNCINYGPNDGLDAGALTEAEIDLRWRMFEVASFFRRHVAGCSEAYPAGAAPSVGQRRARAAHCEYELTAADCTTGRSFDDQIGCFSFIDNPKHVVADAGAYGIPYRALVPRALENMLIAGRMMTVDLVAHNSTRNTACCLVCGQAAGTAAAMAARASASPRDVDLTALRRRLMADGVVLEPKPESP